MAAILTGKQANQEHLTGHEATPSSVPCLLLPAKEYGLETSPQEKSGDGEWLTTSYIRLS